LQLPRNRSRLLAVASLVVALWAGPALAHHVDAADALPAAAAETLAGVVESIAIDDRVHGRAYRLPQIRLADGNVVALIGSATDALHAGDKVVLTGIRNGKALEVATIDAQQAGHVVATKASAEADGLFAVAHSDDFVRGESQYRYEVHADDGHVTPVELSALPATLEGGMRVHISGHDGTAGVVVPDTIVIVAPTPDGPSGKLASKSTTVHTMLVVMANFSNTTAPAFTQAQAQAVMTTNANSVAKFYNEASFGKHHLNVTVMPTWVNTTFAQSGCIDTQLGTFTAAANTAATAAGYNPANYEYVVYLFPSGGCGWSGLGYVGFPRLAYIHGPGSFTTPVVAHEVGHNFGLLHAGSIHCTGVVIGGSCTAAEYGDPYSAMGNQHAGHFNVVQKNILGWIGSPTVVTHAAGTATYTLQPIENGGGTTYGVRIPTPNSSRTYYIEYRQPIGFDGMWTGWTSAGAQVRVAYPFEVISGSDDTEIVDMTPGTSTFNDAALTVGSTFSDPAYPVSITVLSASAGALTVQVTTPGGTGPSTTSVTSSANPSTSGSSVTFSSTVTGTSPTGTVKFTDGGTTISGCSAVALTGSGNSRTAACGTSTLALGTHSIVATYGGDSNNAGSASASLAQTVMPLSWLGFLQGSNLALGPGSAVAAGSSNVASGQGSFVGAGVSNEAAAISSLVIGGFDNHALAIDSIVGAGAGNRATGARAVVVGGGYNLASGSWAFIGGGGRETGSGTAGASAQDQIAAGKWATIAGGNGNRSGTSATQTGPTVGGGEQNAASNNDAAVLGGTLNTASGAYATVFGGHANTATNTGSATSGGLSNTASGQWASVPGGNGSTAGGNYSVAGGRQAKATLAGSVILADGSAFGFSSTAANEFAVRAGGGARVVTAINGSGTPTAGVHLAAGSGSWTSLSDRAAKRDLTAVDGEAVLARLIAMPVYTWRYKTETSGALHMGPVAQDFRAAFGLGDSDRRITSVDSDGVALAALRALQQRAAQRDAAIAARAARIAALRGQLARAEAAVHEVEALKARVAELLAAPHTPVSDVRPVTPKP